MKLLTDPSTLTWDFPCDENYLEDIVFIFHQEEGDHLPDKRIKNHVAPTPWQMASPDRNNKKCAQEFSSLFVLNYILYQEL